MKRVVKMILHKSFFVVSFLLFIFLNAEIVSAAPLLSMVAQANKDDGGFKTKKDIVVAVLDTGIDTDHPEFKDRIQPGGANCIGGTATCIAGGYEDDHGHGTAVSSVVTMNTPANVKILPIKVMDENCNYWSSDLVAAIQYVIQSKKNGVNIVAINVSANSPYNNSSVYKQLEDAIQKAFNLGILFVNSAGNKSIDVETVYPSSLEVPIVVSSVDYVTDWSSIAGKKTYKFSSFSNYGETIDFAAQGSSLTLAKMGTQSYTYGWWGTSFSAPTVAAYIATLYDVCDICTPKTIEKVLRMSAKDYGAEGKDDYYGYGIIDISVAKKLVLEEKPVKIYAGMGIVNTTVTMSPTYVEKGENFDYYWGREISKKYEVSYIEVDGKKLSVAELNKAKWEGGYTFKDVTQQHTIKVYYDVKTMCTIYVTVKGLSLNNHPKELAVKCGENAKYDFDLYAGTKITFMAIDGRILTDAERKMAVLYGFPFTNVDRDHKIVVEYDFQTFKDKVMNIRW